MTDGTATGSKPRGITRFLLRLPIWLYRLRLGWLLGDRFLMFRHTGRKSGLPRYTVVEVVRHDEATGSYVIASGWGEGSDWFRNIQKNPEVVLHTGRRRAPARAERLSHDEAAAELQAYAERHPLAFRALTRMMAGEALEGTAEESRRLARDVPVVKMTPYTPPD
jgi:deazaflavin-dependent oxidoreductase (nitroreductase family)